MQKIPAGAFVFGSLYVDELEKVGEILRRKSRLVLQNYANEGAWKIPTKAPTVQQFSQRLALILAASIPSMTSYTLDVTQAFEKSKTPLKREVYIFTPKKSGVPMGVVLRVVTPLYVISRRGLHWYSTYISHHLEHLGMQRTRTDPCVIVKRKKTESWMARSSFRWMTLSGSALTISWTCRKKHPRCAHRSPELSSAQRVQY